MNNLIFLVNQINQAIVNHKLELLVSHTKLNISFCKLLYREGLISSYSVIHSFSRFQIRILFKYYQNKSVIQSINLLSKPGHISYWKHYTIRKYSALYATSIFILSNAYLGLCTNRQALRAGQGGIALFEIK